MISDIKLKRSISAFVSVLLVVGSVISLFRTSSIVTKAAENSDRIIVSMGDSYSSGEGITPFFDQELKISEKVKSQNWLAHRSKNAWSGMLTLKDVEGEMSDHYNENWFFVAASGAVTGDITGKQKKEYVKDYLLNSQIGVEFIDPQIEVFDKLNKKGLSADYVTLTLGGNDAGFSDVMETTALHASYLGINETYDMIYGDEGIIKKKLPTIKTNLKECYKIISQKSKAPIIVAGYPELLGSMGAVSSPIKNSAFTTLVVGSVFTPYEASMINNAVNIFNDAIYSIVDECDDSIPVYFVSVKDAFKGKGAYSKNEFINGICIPGAQDIDNRSPIGGASFHPNKKGAKAYADCVQAQINKLEGITPRPKPTEKPTDKAVEIPTHKPPAEANQGLQSKLNDLISEYGVASTETYTANTNTTSNMSWTNREGIVSAKLSDLDGDEINELVVVRLIGGNLNPYSENIEIQVYYYTKEGVKSAGALKYLTGDDFKQKQIDAFIFKNGNQKYIMLESDFTMIGTDVSEMSYDVIKYENGKIAKDRCVYLGESDFGARWIEQTWDGDIESEQDIYFKDLEHTTATGTYKDSEDPILDYFKDFGLPKTEDAFELSRHHKYLNVNGSEKLFELIHSRVQTDLYKYSSSLTDYTDLDHSKSTTSAEKVEEWKELYISHFKEQENKSTLDYASFHIVDVNEDGTLELVYTGFAAMGTHMVWVKDGAVQDQAVGYGEFKYIPSKNQIYCQYVNHGMINDNVYSFTDRDLEKTFSGQILPKENGFENPGWSVNGENVSESEYNSQLKNAFNFDSSKSLDYEDSINGSDLLSRIKDY